MNKEVEEIKEHLDFAREVFDYTLNPSQCGLLLDYINQLEEEINNPLRGIFAEVTDDVLLRSNAMNYGEAQDYKKNLLDIKEIVDKALETGDKQ